MTYYGPTATFMNELMKLVYSYAMLKSYHADLEISVDNTWTTW